MKFHIRQSQIKTIREIQEAIKTYIRWKRCRTQATYFKQADLRQFIFHLETIQQITDESKIAKKAHQLAKLCN